MDEGRELEPIRMHATRLGRYLKRGVHLVIGAGLRQDRAQIHVEWALEATLKLARNVVSRALCRKNAKPVALFCVRMVRGSK